MHIFFEYVQTNKKIPELVFFTQVVIAAKYPSYSSRTLQKNFLPELVFFTQVVIAAAGEDGGRPRGARALPAQGRCVYPCGSLIIFFFCIFFSPAQMGLCRGLRA